MRLGKNPIQIQYRWRRHGGFQGRKLESSQWPAETGKHVPKSSSQAPEPPCLRSREPLAGSAEPLAGSTRPPRRFRKPTRQFYGPYLISEHGKFCGLWPSCQVITIQQVGLQKKQKSYFCWNYLVKAHQKHKYSFWTETAWIRISLLLWFCYLGRSLHILQLPVSPAIKDEYRCLLWHCCIIRRRDGCMVFSILGIWEHYFKSLAVTVVVMEERGRRWWWGGGIGGSGAGAGGDGGGDDGGGDDGWKGGGAMKLK